MRKVTIKKTISKILLAEATLMRATQEEVNEGGDVVDAHLSALVHVGGNGIDIRATAQQIVNQHGNVIDVQLAVIVEVARKSCRLGFDSLINGHGACPQPFGCKLSLLAIVGVIILDVPAVHQQ